MTHLTLFDQERQAHIAGHMKHINIKVAAQAPDYHDLTLRVLHHLEVKLYGGYYEPLSQRDCALADALSKMLETYEREL